MLILNIVLICFNDSCQLCSVSVHHSKYTSYKIILFVLNSTLFLKDFVFWYISRCHFIRLLELCFNGPVL